MKQTKMNSGFRNIPWQVRPGFGELNLVTATAGPLFCFVAKSEPRRVQEIYEGKTQRLWRRFWTDSSLKQLIWIWFQASLLRGVGVSTFCLLPLHFRTCTPVGPPCTSLHTPFAPPPLYFGHKKDIVLPKTDPNHKHTSNLGWAQAHIVPATRLQNSNQIWNFLVERIYLAAELTIMFLEGISYTALE